MSLELQASAHTYIIKSKSTEGAYIGRNIKEDMSLLPKSIQLLPKNFPEVPKWEISKSSEGTFILKSRGSHASDIKKLLFGVLLPDPPATNWKIEAQPQHGKHIYTITVAGKPDGWVSPHKEFEQVIVHPLIVAPSLPPRYPLTELFEITPSD